ncbi:uncharacterized protein UDID_18521 [Ustilago sp. UG-2017a]|nr:uncharacterized protein UDID_18521 [Ustilago sp. UG-2017a]
MTDQGLNDKLDRLLVLLEAQLELTRQGQREERLRRAHLGGEETIEFSPSGERVGGDESMIGDPQTPTPAPRPRQSVSFAGAEEQDDINYEKYASPTGPKYLTPGGDPYSRTRTEPYVPGSEEDPSVLFNPRDVEIFILEAEAWFKFNQVYEQTRMINHMGSQLEGNAREWWTSKLRIDRAREGRLFNDWHYFTERLSEQFNPQNARMEAYNKLLALKLTSNAPGAATRHVEHFRDLEGQVNLDDNELIIDLMLLQQSSARHPSAAPPRLNPGIQPTPPTQSSFPVRQPAQRNSARTPALITAGSPSRPTNRLLPQQYVPGLKQGGPTAPGNSTCHICKGVGHWARDCPSKKADPLGPRPLGPRVMVTMEDPFEEGATNSGDGHTGSAETSDPDDLDFSHYQVPNDISHEEPQDDDDEGNDRKAVLELTGTVQDHPARILTNTGAGLSIVSDSFISKYLIPTKPSKTRSIHGVTGRQLIINSTTTIQVVIGEHSLGVVEVSVADTTDYDLILGFTELRRLKPTIRWDTGQLEFKSQDRTQPPEAAATRGLQSKPSKSVIVAELPRNSTKAAATGKQKQELAIRDSLSPISTRSVVTGSYEEKMARPTMHGNEFVSAKRLLQAALEDRPIGFMLLEVPPSSLPAFGFIPTGADKGVEMEVEVDKEVTTADIPKPYQHLRDVFDEVEADKLPHHTEHDLHLELMEGSRPPQGPLYLKGPKEMSELRKYLDENLVKGFIRPSKSPARSPVLFVPKKDGGLRLCVDYRGLNEITVKNRAPLPLIEEQLFLLRKAKIYSKLDLQVAYNLICIAKGDEWKTVFGTQLGLYEYLVMPFGLANAPAHFQSFINVIFRDIIGVYVVVYLGDFLIFSDTEEAHVRHVTEVLTRLRNNWLFAKLLKCEFHTTTVEFLGYIIKPTGVEMDPEKVRTPLTSLVKLTERFKKFELETDASDFAIAGVLKQEHEGRWHLVVFYSRKMSSAEKNYEIHDKELLALVILTDHEALKYFKSQRRITGRQARWVVLLADFDFVLQYRPGDKGGEPDALTRRADMQPVGEEQEHNVRQLLPPRVFEQVKNEIATGMAPVLTMESIATKGIKDLARIFQPLDPELQEIHLRKPFEIRDALWYSDGWLVIPKVTMPGRTNHHHLRTGHVGWDATIKSAQRHYWWPNMSAWIADYVASCQVCARYKAPRHRPYGLLQPLATPDRPWGSISLDFIEGLPPSKGYDSILVIVDRLTKFAILAPTYKTVTAKQTAVLLWGNLVRHFGYPDHMVSDRGRQFISGAWKAFADQMGMKHLLSTAYHPQTDGQTKRVNQVVEQYLRMYCNYEQNDWAGLLNTAAFVYNNTVHNSISVSPFFACYGWNPKAHPDIPQHLGVNNPERSEYLFDGKERCKYLQEQIREAQRRTVDHYNWRHKDIEFKVGDMVYINHKNWKTRRPTPKLDTRFAGPYPVQERVGRRAYRITLPANLRVHDVFHVSLLEPARNSSIPQRSTLPIVPLLPDKDLDFEVEAIVGKRSHNGATQYKVLWRGYPEEAASWEPLLHLNCPDLIREYEVSARGRD